MRKNSCMFPVTFPASAAAWGAGGGARSLTLYARAGARSIVRFAGIAALSRGFFRRLFYGSLAGTAFLAFADFLQIRLKLLALRLGERLDFPGRRCVVDRQELGVHRRALRHSRRQPERSRDVIPQGR